MAATARFPWIAVSAVAAVGVVSIVAWLQLPEAELRTEPAPPSPALGLTRIDPALTKELLAEQLAAYDPTPLFLPSAMNNNEPPLPDEARPGMGGPFAALPPQLTKTGLLAFPAPVAVPRNPVDGLRLTERSNAPLALARGDTAGKPLEGRLGRVEAVSVDGGVVLTLDLPRSLDLPAGDWQPLELMGAITRSGLAGELVITTSSGSDEIDDYFRSHLRKTMRIGERLSEGFYVFRVGP
ncbi:MAG: hypothetical protein K0R17_2317 [Rariglobus sp.]|jgi:hypothetical protein|nr:hypothetical protein [Rariglobus sp.]